MNLSTIGIIALMRVGRTGTVARVMVEFRTTIKGVKGSHVENYTGGVLIDNESSTWEPKLMRLLSKSLRN